jgi:hypothetical protein
MKESFSDLSEYDTYLSCESKIDIAKEDIKVIRDFDRSLRSSGGSVDEHKTIPEVVAFATLELYGIMSLREIRLRLSKKMLKSSERLIQTYGSKASETITEILKTKS